MRSGAWLVVGDDPYLVMQALQDVLGQAGDLSVEEFGPRSEGPDIARALDTPLLFGGERAVVLRDLDQFPAEVHSLIISHLKGGAVAGTLVMTCQKAPSAVAAAVRKAGNVIEAAKGKRGEVFGWLREKVRASGLNVTSDAIEALVEVVGDERMALAQALEELSIASGARGRIRGEDVRRQFTGAGDTTVFVFVDQVAARDAPAALSSLARLISQGESVFGALWFLVRHFRMLLQVGDSTSRQVAQDLKVHQWQAEKLVRHARGFQPAEIIQAYQALAEVERRIKMGEEPEQLALEKAVVSIAGRRAG